jgi:hypothetical protein
MKRKSIFLAATLLLSGAVVFFNSCRKGGDTAPLPQQKEEAASTNGKGGGGTPVYSGEDIFRGIFFLEGDIPSRLPSLRQYAADLQRLSDADENVRTHRKQLADVIVRNINARDPEFFSRFAAAITSKNMYTVSDILNEAGRLVEVAGLATEEYANLFKWGPDLLSNPETLAAINSIDVSTEDGVRQLDQFVQQHQLEPTKFVACTPAVAICVYYVIAVAHSQAAVSYNAVAAVNIIGYFTVIVKTKFLFWRMASNDPNSATLNELFVKEVASSF